MSQDLNDAVALLNGDVPANSLPPFVGNDALAQVAGPVRDSELTVAPKAVPSIIQRADAVHSTAAGGAGYRVKVKGEYFALAENGKGKTKKNYEAEFNVAKLDGCLSVIKNKLLKSFLKKKDPTFTADRTCYVVDTTPLGSSPKSNNLAFMDRGQLEQFVAGSTPRIPIRLEDYPQTPESTTHLRESIIDYVQNPDSEGKTNTFARREADRQEKRAEARDLALLNPDLEVA